MAEVDSYRPDDRRAVEALYRRVFGSDAAEASRLRWEWQYGAIPTIPAARLSSGSRARDRRSSVSTRRCRCSLWVGGREVDASWGMDVMVAPERQRQGIGEVLFRTWDSEYGRVTRSRPVRVLASPVPEAAVARARAGPVPGEAVDAPRRSGVRTGRESVNRLVSAVTLPLVKIVSRTRPLRRGNRDDSAVSAPSSRSCGNGWRRSSTSPSAAMRGYLNWKYIEAPYVRYSVAALEA